MKDIIIQFYEKYADYAYRVALVRTNNKADAEDLSQEVVLNIIKNHDILKELINKDESQAKGYLAKAVVNMTIERYKKSSSRLKRENVFANTKMIAIDESDDIGNVDENKHAILSAIKDLPEKYQSIIMLKFYEGHSNSELSNILNLKEVSIRSLISRAIQKLKNQLKASSITLSVASITTCLEATKLIPASPEFKIKLTQVIHNNYKPFPLTSSSAVSYKIMSFLFFGVFTGFFLYKYAFPFLKRNQVTEQITNIQEKSQQSISTPIENKPLFSFDLNMKNTASREKLRELVHSKLDIKNNKKISISFEKKGITTIGPGNVPFNLPYTLMPGKAIVIYCEADILSNNGPKLSSVGIDLKLSTPHDYHSNYFSRDDTIYKLKYTILNQAIFAESTLFENMRVYKIEDGGFQKPIGFKANNAIIRQISIHEMDAEEIKAFTKKNADEIKIIEAYIAEKK